MVRSHPVLTACALSLLFPTAATAGPIEWEATAQLVRVGDATGPWSRDITPEFIGGGSTIHEQTFSRLASAGPVGGWGWQSVRVGSLFPDGPRYDPLHGAPGTFAVNLTLTDRATGDTGTAAFAGVGWEVLEQDLDHVGWLLSRRSYAELRGETERTLTVGGTEYQVGLRAVDRDGIVDFFADVRAGDVLATPEPTSLALAALGLGALGLRRRFRRAGVAVVALLLAPQLASAGPLSWGFRAETPEGVVLRDITGITDSYYDDHFLADPQFYGTYQGSRIGVGFRSESWETAAWLTFTDETSGATGESRVWWRWVKEYEVRPDGSEDQFYEGYNSGPWNEPARLTLGAHVYEVRGPGGDLQVTVTPFVPVAAPEPTTLALAGVGLLPLLARAARRRTNRCA